MKLLNMILILFSSQIGWTLEPQVPCDTNCEILAKEKITELSKLKSSFIRIRPDAKLTYLYFHSYTMDPLKDNRYFLEELESNLNLNIIALPFSGHGRGDNPNDFNEITYKNWDQDAEQFLKIAQSLNKPIVVHGFSMGGLFAIRMALRHPNSITKLILNSPALMITKNLDNAACLGKSDTVFKIAKSIFKGFSKDYLKKYLNGACELSKAILDTRNQFKSFVSFDSYEGVSNKEYFYSLDLIEHIAKQLKMPASIIYSEADEIVEPAALDAFSKNISSDNKLVYSFSDQVSHVEANFETESMYYQTKIIKKLLEQ